MTHRNPTLAERSRAAQYRFTTRLGFAWDVLGTGKLSLRGGYGIYSNKIGEYSYVNNMRTNPPGYANPSLDLFSGATAAQFSYGTSDLSQSKHY
jgi:hypothetical protein